MLKPAIARVFWSAQDAGYYIREELEREASLISLEFQSQAWRDWLAGRSSFAFQGKDGHRFTARKETRARGSIYWIAYRKLGGKLTHSYIGRGEHVTLARLEEVAAFLAGQASQQTSRESSAEMEWQSRFLATKFFVPIPPHALIDRSRLFTLLDEGRRHTLTLVSAPAGFGKTTLLSRWVQTLPSGGPHVAWVSLDEADNDPVRFWSYVFAAFDRALPGLCSEYVASLQGEVSPPLQHVLTACLNRFTERPERFLLVLDDYHLIEEQTIHSSLASFIERLPPQVCVVISTRADPPLPLARLRGRGQLLEVRAEQLRTTPEEARTFLHEVMGVELADRELAMVEERTEGWLVGLQLAGLSLQGRPASIDLFEGISGRQGYILDYLTEEVLWQQPEAIQNFLLRTSILERFTASLCDAVLQQSGSQQVLDALEHANLFVVSLDARRRWYRYHALFAEVLRSRLEQTEEEEVRELHLRASQWYARQGNTIAAVQYAIHAQDWERAADLLEPLSQLRFWGREQTTALRFLKNLPPEKLRSRPLLALLYAHILDPDTSFTTADAWMQIAEEGLRTLVAERENTDAKSASNLLFDQAPLLGDVLIHRASLRATRGDALEAQTYLERARHYLVDRHIENRALLAFNESMIHMVRGEAVPATKKIGEALAVWQPSGNIASPEVIITCHYMAAYYLVSRGHLREAWRFLEQADHLGTRIGSFPPPSLAPVYAYQAHLMIEWHRLDEALERAKRAIHLTQTTHGSMAFTALAFLLKVLLARSEIEEASTVLRQAEDLITHLQNPYLFALYVLVDRVRLWLASDEISQAAAWAKQVERESPLPSPLAQERVEVALARVKLAQRKPEEALTFLMPRLEKAIQQERGGHVIELRLLSVLAHYMRGEEQEALATLSQTVRTAEPEGYIGAFVSEGVVIETLLFKLRDQQRLLGATPYLDTLLAAFSPTRPQENARDRVAPPRLLRQSLLDPLSGRELEVLRLLARGVSNQDIAEELVISLDTVKRHVSNILSKLGASNRTQAVMQARQLSLL